MRTLCRQAADQGLHRGRTVYCQKPISLPKLVLFFGAFIELPVLSTICEFITDVRKISHHICDKNFSYKLLVQKVFYNLKKLKIYMRFKNNFKRFQFYQKTTIYFNFDTNYHSFLSGKVYQIICKWHGDLPILFPWFLMLKPIFSISVRPNSAG